jgi:molybdate/tungstate transport system substrate-binding protein
MTKQRRTDDVGRRSFLAAAGGAVSLGLAGCIAPSGGSGSGGSLTAFHAGSLAPPFSTAESKFEDETGIDVTREAKGSVGSTKKITEEGRSAEILGVSDFRLIRDMMLQEYSDWYGIFATNAMAIGYTDDSKYADEFSKGNWWEVLSRDDVAVAHSDPAVDPNGYRSVMAMKLGAIEFEGSTLYDKETAKALQKNAKITSGTETDLIGQLESGALDYAWEYASAGATHEELNVVQLQPHVNLAKATDAYANHYAKAKVNAGGNTYTGAPIAYGITVPSVAENPEAGAKWVEYMTTGDGKGIMEDSGFSTVSPMVVPESTKSSVPDSVMDGAEAKSSLGPLEL